MQFMTSQMPSKTSQILYSFKTFQIPSKTSHMASKTSQVASKTSQSLDVKSETFFAPNGHLYHPSVDKEYRYTRNVHITVSVFFGSVRGKLLTFIIRSFPLRQCTGAVALAQLLRNAPSQIIDPGQINFKITTPSLFFSLTGPLWAVLARIFPYRLLTILGGIISTTGIFCAGLSTNFTQLNCSMALLGK